MKLTRIITLCAITAALALSLGSASAQNNGNGGGNGGGGGGGGRQRFNPQMMMQRYQEQLGFTNDTDWAAVQPLVQKVMDARMALGRGGFGGRQRGGGGGQGGPGMGGQPNPEREALQNALDQDAPTDQIKDLLAKYKASQKAKQAALDQAQADLKQVLTTKQEAQAVLMGLLN